MQRQNVCRPLSLFLLGLVLMLAAPTSSRADPQDLRLASFDVQLNEPEGIETASGELYDPEAWSAAIQIGLRGAFGGIHYGRNYRPAFALVECGDRRAIVRVNDVGPLMPGRVIDLN